MIETGRLLLRQWKPEDREPFALLNADPEVMRYFPATLSRTESDAMADRIQSALNQRKWGLFAAELRSKQAFIGFIGLSVPGFEAFFTPCVEIGWRLAREHWNQGLATEGARAIARFAFENLKLPSIVSFTAEENLPSRRVMEKIGMRHEADFDHPKLAQGHPLRRHVLYRLAGSQSSMRLPSES